MPQWIDVNKITVSCRNLDKYAEGSYWKQECLVINLLIVVVLVELATHNMIAIGKCVHCATCHRLQLLQLVFVIHV